jgi:phage terminase Nu1 subunit (DNA packaging protein)
MPKAEATKNHGALSVIDVAELLGVTDRQVRNWIKDKGLPAKGDPRGRTLVWSETLAWYVAYRIAETGGSGGSRKAVDPDSEPLESMEAALARKTRAEADLKELQLARERSEVAAIADVERVLGAANKSIQTLLLALPASLAPQLLGLEDHNKIFAVIDRGVKATLSNLASIDAILQAKRVSGDEDE